MGAHTSAQDRRPSSSSRTGRFALGGTMSQHRDPWGRFTDKPRRRRPNVIPGRDFAGRARLAERQREQFRAWQERRERECEARWLWLMEAA